MDKSVELPIQSCDVRVTVGRDGVWLHLGEHTMFHVASTLGNTGGVIGSNVNKWVIARQQQAQPEPRTAAGSLD